MENMPSVQSELWIPDNALKVVRNILYVILSYVFCKLSSKPADQKLVTSERHVN